MLDLKCNYKAGKSDLKCRKCQMFDEDQEHLLNCADLSDNSVLSSQEYLPVYQDLFCDNTIKIKNIGQILHQKFKLLTQPCAQTTSAAVNPS